MKNGKKKGYDDLILDVLGKGLCCGCGTCVGVCPTGSLVISYGEPPDFDAEPQPKLVGECNDCSLCYDLCPGKEVPLQEIDQFLFGRHRDLENEPLGIYQNIFAGYAKNAGLRKKGASGGAATAILLYALEAGVIDGAIVAQKHPEYPWRFVPTIATKGEEIIQAASSKYCVVPTNAVLGEVVNGLGLKKVGVMGCPCHIEAIRKMQISSRPRKIAEAIKLTVSLFCATNFLYQATKHILFEECGIADLNDVGELVYRGGEMPKHFIVTTVDGAQRKVDLFPSYLNYFFPFQSERCSMCYDWSGEVADIAVGDLWEPFTRPNEPGWNAIIARTQAGMNVIIDAGKKGYLFARKSYAEYTIASIGCECKKHGHAYNLSWRKRHGWAVPNYGYDPGIPGPWPAKWRNAFLKAGLAGQGGVK